MPNTFIDFCGVELKNPVIAASGTFGFGREYDEYYDISRLGGISCKGLTLEPRTGNPPPRIAETASGILNSVGLQNPGADHFIAHDLPWLKEKFNQKNTAIIVNIAGREESDYRALASMLSDTPADIIELNISCPNVRAGCLSFGASPEGAEAITAAVRKTCKQPLMVKLSPNAASIADIAKAVESAGADAISLINTITGMRIDINTRRPILRNNTGGLSGAAVFPVAVRMVSEVYRAVSIPVCGMGGVTTGLDAIEMMMAGASCIQVGTAIFADLFAPLKIIDEIENWLDDKNISDINEIIGSAKLY